MAIVWTNFASSTLASDILSTDTIIQIQSSDQGNFPLPTGGDYAVIVLESDTGTREITHMTSRTGNSLTISRGQEGTDAASFLTGSRVECRITAGFLNEFIDGGTF